MPHDRRHAQLWVLVAIIAIPLAALTQALPAPKVTAVSPNQGFNGSATPITITGSGFQPGATVVFNANASIGPATFVNSTTLTATVPAGLLAITYGVRVFNPDGQSSMEGVTFTLLETQPALGSYFSLFPHTVIDTNYPAHYGAGFTADLNGDGKDDLVV